MASTARPGALGSHQTITVPADSSNHYRMKNDEWSVKVSIPENSNSRNQQRIKGDAKLRLSGMWFGSAISLHYPPCNGAGGCHADIR